MSNLRGIEVCEDEIENSRCMFAEKAILRGQCIRMLTSEVLCGNEDVVGRFGIMVTSCFIRWFR